MDPVSFVLSSSNGIISTLFLTLSLSSFKSIHPNASSRFGLQCNTKVVETMCIGFADVEATQGRSVD